MAFIKKIFSGISSAVKWLTQDDARLREARARSLGQLDETDKNKTTDADQDIKEYIDPWEELDHFRTDMWFGRWGRQYTKLGVDKLKKRLKGEGEDEPEKGKDKPD
jgi:hypothetical protein